MLAVLYPQGLKELRSIKTLTQEEVGNDIKANRDLNIHIGRIETGRNNISVSTLFVLCDYYEISISDFFGRVEKNDKSLNKKLNNIEEILFTLFR